jgi:hypothetical protein
MPLQGQLQVLVPGVAEFDVIITNAAVVHIQTFTEVEITSHVIVIENDVHDQVADQVTGSVKRGCELIKIHVFIEVYMEFFDLVMLGPALAGEEKEDDYQNKDKCTPVIKLIGAGHKDGTGKSPYSNGCRSKSGYEHLKHILYLPVNQVVFITQSLNSQLKIYAMPLGINSVILKREV